MGSNIKTKPLLDPLEAMAALIDRLQPVGQEVVDLTEAHGRVLAEAVQSDRPSPSCDVSAMDGYAVRVDECQVEKLPVAGQIPAGQAPQDLPQGACLKIFTGSAVPPGADAVIQREHVQEHGDWIGLPEELSLRLGQNIRRVGENLPAGQVVLASGIGIDATVAGALATFGVVRPKVFQKVRVALATTGDEVLSPEAQPEPWQLRNANGPALRALIATVPWAKLGDIAHLPDEPKKLSETLASLMAGHDLVLVTGGVSMGDHDHVPNVLESLGASIVFHKLAQRPGKPMLGAVGPEGGAVLGLPGNPVSVMITAHRIGLPVMRRLGGLSEVDPPVPTVEITNPDDRPLKLYWHRLVKLKAGHGVELVPSKGSGDLVSAARADGFIEVPPGQTGPGPWPYHAWSV